MKNKRLSTEEVKKMVPKIKSLANQGLYLNQIASEIGISKSTVQNVVNRHKIEVKKSPHWLARNKKQGPEPIKKTLLNVRW